MIGRLRGQVIEKHPPVVLVDVAGVGYEVEVPLSTFHDLPGAGEAVTLHTHLAIKEDAHSLYGFASQRERTVFRTLIRISGVGPKLALTLLSGMRVEELLGCIEAQDTSALTRVPGVGKKTAERLLVELRDRIDGLGLLPSAAAGTGVAPAGETPAATDAVSEAVAALIALGYKPPEASQMVRKLDASERSSEELIRMALQGAAR
ncbi:Holliday junction branch migration protein RuvA [Ectothiorhodospiraceae bacterium WFHF3C12]|nr:Holliday junction branch migration protein RuvA [Ectothiorhodospiraceae bacterium WFHF3C12]